jgi:hypothetical protein
MARRPLIVRPGEDCLAHRNEGDAHRARGPLHNVFAAAPGDGGQIILARRQDFQMIVVAANPDDLFDAIVIGFEFLIAQRPVFLDALQRPLFEISRGVAQGNGVPMQGSAPEGAHSIDRDVDRNRHRRWILQCHLDRRALASHLAIPDKATRTATCGRATPTEGLHVPLPT